jgi:Ala-tRNA(Pro) deacylase
MAIAPKVQDYMARRGARYDVLKHPHSQSSMETAELAHVPGNRLAKSVVLQDDQGFVIAVLPSTCHVKVEDLCSELNRNLRLVTEKELPSAFSDCELGAIPPVGPAYGMTTVVDQSLTDEPEIYFEAGDHEQLIRMQRDDFVALMDRATRARFAARM